MTDADHDSASADAGEKLVLNSPEEASTLKDFLLWAGVIVLAVLSVYSPALHGKFLWDDDRHVEANRDLHDANGLGDIWTGHWRLYFEGKDDANKVSSVFTPQYYPFTHTTYWIESQIFGTTDPTVFHVDNMLLHAAGAILLWFLLRELAVPGAWVAAAIFALHPINVESVAWISERKNVLAGALFFGSILAFLKSPMGLHREGAATGKDRDLTLYFVAVALFILAVLSKTVACSMPAVVLLLLWWKRGKLTRQDFAWTAPMFVVGLALSHLTSWVEVHHIGASGSDWDRDFTQRLLLAGNAIWFYAGKLIAPINLAFFYPKWNLDPDRPVLWIGPIAVIVVLAALFTLQKKLGRGPLVGGLIFVGVLTPALGFFNVFPMKYSFVADHFQYLAGPALIVLIVAPLTLLMRKLPAQAPYAAAGVVLLVLAIGSAAHAMIFASSLDLWVDTARKNPNSAPAHYNAGVAWFHAVNDDTVARDKEPAERLSIAKDELATATRLDHKHDRAFELLGEVLSLQSKPDEAIKQFDSALAIDPANVDAAMGRGRSLLELKRTDDALVAYGQAKAILESERPHASRTKAAQTFTAIGRILLQKGDRDGAASNYKQAIDIVDHAPAIPLAEPHYEYGVLLAAANQKPPAAEQFALAIRAQPDYIEPRLALGKLMLEVGNFGGAQQQFAAAVRINPYYPGVSDAAKAFDAAIFERLKVAAMRLSTTRAGHDKSESSRHNAMTSIRIANLSKRFGETIALKVIDLQINAGELFFLLGPSGCGKSTLLRLIAGLMKPSGGRIFFNDRDVTNLPTKDRNAVMVFQSYALWPHMSVAENVRFGLSVRGSDRAACSRSGSMKFSASSAMRRIRQSQAERAFRWPTAASVALARALAVKPACLLLDEPLSNLDAKLRQEMRQEIRRYL